MADILTENGNTLGIASVGFGAYQPKAKYLWTVEINVPSATVTAGGILAGAGGGNVDRVFSVTAFKAIRPKFEFEEIVVTHLNEHAGFPGKIKKPENISLEFNDGMQFQASQSSIISAYDCANACNQWKQVLYNSDTGSGSYASDLKGWIVISLLDPTFRPVEQWTGVGAFPVSVEMGDLSYEDGAAKCTVVMSLSIDKWYSGDRRGNALNSRVAR